MIRLDRSNTGVLRSLRGLFAPGADAPRIEDKGEVDRRFRRLRLQVVATLTITYGFYYTTRLGLSVVKKPLIDGGILTAEELGWIGAAFLWGYGIGKVGNGIIADRLNARALVPAGLVVSALINLVMGCNTGVLVALVLWAINGWFQGIGAPTCVVSINQWCSSRERGTAYGIWSAAHSIGEGITFVGTSALVAATVWRSAFWGPGVFCLGVAAASYVLLRDRPQTVGLPSANEWRGLPPSSRPGEHGAQATIGRAQLDLLTHPALWIVGTSSALMYVTRYAVNSWGVLYLQEEHGFELEAAGSLIGINTIAGIVGSAAYGFISDRFFRARRPPVTLIYGVLEVAALVLIFYGPPGPEVALGVGFTTLRFPVLLALGFVVYGFTLSGILAVLGGLFAVDLADKKATGFAMGFVGAFSYLGAGIQELVSGILIERGTTIVDGHRVYDFSTPVVFWVGSSVLSAVLATTLWKVESRE